MEIILNENAPIQHSNKQKESRNSLLSSFTFMDRHEGNISQAKVFQLPTEFFIAIAMLFLAYFSLRDITLMSVHKSKRR